MTVDSEGQRPVDGNAVSILDYAEMLSGNFPTAQERAEGLCWLARNSDRLAADRARSAIINAWEMGALSAPKALTAIIESRTLDFELVMVMLATHDRACAVIEDI